MMSCQGIRWRICGQVGERVNGVYMDITHLVCCVLSSLVLYCGVLYYTMLEYYIGRLDNNGEYTFPSLPLCNY